MLGDLINWIVNNYLEFIAVIAGIAGVYLTTKQIIWCWPVAIINVLLSIYIFLGDEIKLYQDAMLQGYYLVMAFYGWYAWLYGGKNKSVLEVSLLKIRNILFILIIGAISILLFGYFFDNYTDASLPYWDATTTVWGVIGTFLMARKKIENWIIWIIVDLINMGVYYYKELYGFTFLYFIFTILAVYGLNQWTRDLKKIKTL